MIGPRFRWSAGQGPTPPRNRRDGLVAALRSYHGSPAHLQASKLLDPGLVPGVVAYPAGAWLPADSQWLK